MTDMFSTLDNPRLEFAMEVRLQFPRVQTILNTPMGGNRSAVYVDGGTFEGPRIREDNPSDATSCSRMNNTPIRISIG